MIKVSVVVPVYNNAVGLDKLLSALEIQSYPRELFEIIVVDNGSIDESVAVAVSHQSRNLIRILSEQTTKGSYASRNAGIQRARGDVLAFTDADCVPPNNWVSVAQSLFDSRPEISRLAGPIELAFRSGPLTTVELFEKVFAFQQKEAASRGWAITANMFVRRTVFEAIGLFDSELKSGGDREWGLRAAAAGHTIRFYPDLRVEHAARFTWDQLYKKHARMLGSRWILARRAFRKTPSLASVITANFPLHGVTQRVSWFPGAKRALATTLLMSPIQRLQVLAAIVFITCINISEYLRLRLGGQPRRE